MRYALQADDDVIEDSIPLTTAEKALKGELEEIVQNGMAEFLRVGAALSELRSKRLYRREFATFEIYPSAEVRLAPGAC